MSVLAIFPDNVNSQEVKKLFLYKNNYIILFMELREDSGG